MTGSGVVLLALLLAAPQQSSRPGEVGQQHQPPAKQASKPVTTTAAHQVLPENRGDTSSKKENGSWTHADWIQVVTAASTALYFCATLWILVEMKRANNRERRTAARSLWLTRKSNKLTTQSLQFTRESFELAHRPYLQPLSFDGPPIGGSPIVTVTLVVKNVGATAANNVVTVWWERGVEGSEPFELIQMSNRVPPSNTPMRSVGAGGELADQHQFRLDPIAHGAVGNGSLTLYVVCLFHYQDDFGVWHMYFVSYRYNPYHTRWEPYRDHRQRLTAENEWHKLMRLNETAKGKPVDIDNQW